MKESKGKSPKAKAPKANASQPTQKTLDVGLDKAGMKKSNAR